MGTLVNDPYVLGDLRRCCEKACEMEERRYQSLVDFSARLLTSVSILSVAMAAIAGIEYEGQSLLFSGQWGLLVAAGIALATAFALLLISKFRFKVLLIASPLTAIEKDFMVHDFESEVQSTNYYVKTLSNYHKSFESRNEILKRLLNWSLLFSIVAAVLFVSWTVSHCF